jgi:2-dehydropantoate 2-reductase
MKIGVVGCGALGSFYGAKLCASGQEVHFLLRSDYEAVRTAGVEIRSTMGDFLARPHCAKRPEDIGTCELVLIGLKTTANHALAQLLPPLVGPATAVVTLQNGLGNEEQLAALVGARRILGGLCFVCLNRISPGVVLHSAHGDVVLGEYEGGPQPRTEEIAGLFRVSGIRCPVTENLARAHWEKLIWNVPFNGLGVAGTAGYKAVTSGQVAAGQRLGPCLTTQDLLGDSRWEGLVRELMSEVIAAAAALGFTIPSSVIEIQIERTRRMGPYKASTLIDFERGLPLETESLFLEPLRRARMAGVSAPRLANLAEVLSVLDPARKAE